MVSTGIRRIKLHAEDEGLPKNSHLKLIAKNDNFSLAAAA